MTGESLIEPETMQLGFCEEEIMQVKVGRNETPNLGKGTILRVNSNMAKHNRAAAANLSQLVEGLYVLGCGTRREVTCMGSRTLEVSDLKGVIVV